MKLMVDQLGRYMAKEMLKKIEDLWAKVDNMHLVSGDTLNLDLSVDDLVLDKTTVYSKEAGLEWLADKYQEFEAVMYGEDKDASKTGD